VLVSFVAVICTYFKFFVQVNASLEAVQNRLPFTRPLRIRSGRPRRSDTACRSGPTLVVYGVIGRAVERLLATGSHGAGTDRVRLDATSLASGIYVVRLQAGATQTTRRVTVVK